MDATFPLFIRARTSLLVVFFVAAIDPYAAFDPSVPSPEADMCPGI